MRQKTIMVIVGIAVLFVSISMDFGISNSMAQTGAELTEKERAVIFKGTTELLTSREWLVSLTPEEIGKSSKKKPKEETDVLTFTDRTVKSKFLADKGYSTSGSNYSLNITDEGIVFWETVQRDENLNPAFLRGELIGTVMKGSIITKSKRGENIIYYFTSTPETKSVSESKEE